MKTKISITMDEQTVSELDSIIDNLFIRNRSQAIEYLVKSSLGENKSAVILAGGAKTLMIGNDAFSITSKYKGITVIERAVRKLREFGFKQVHLIARHPILTAVFNILKDGSGYGVKMNYVEDTSTKGTASTLKLLNGKIKSRFLIVYGDIIFEKVSIDALWNQHIKGNAVATITLTTSAVPEEKGTVKMEGSRILEFIQKPKKSDVHLVFSPIIAAEPELIEQEGDSLEYDVFPRLAARGLLEGHVSSEKEIHIHTNKDLD
jgi:NDP-sugar pyrophosphorylase family protein